MLCTHKTTSLPVWIISSQLHHRISTNSQPFLVGIVSSDDNQVIQQENVCSEPPEPLSYSLFQSHFQGSSTSNTQKIFLPKPIWEKLSKDQQQMIIDHNRSLPKSGSPHISTPNKSPSPLPHKPTPQQTAKSQQVHTHQSDESTTDTIKTETTPSDPLLAMVH